MEFNTNRVEKSRITETDFENLQFGTVFSDHMLFIDYEDGKWQIPNIVPYGQMLFYPSMTTLHYGQAVFEGLKAFKTSEGKVNVFRPDKHYERITSSSHRMCIPEITKELFFDCLDELLKIDFEWIPSKRGSSLYIRPFTFATDHVLGVKVSDNYKFMILTCPVASYYKEGLNPTCLITSGEYVRAIKGGLGETKTPANYAASLYPYQKAKEKGYTQVLWLDGVEKKYIDEVGTTNIFFLIGDDLITPPLDGSILAGVTRDSVITLAKDFGVNVVEKRISIDDIFESSENGTLKEIFGTGTAAVISPVGKLEHLGKTIVINNGKTGSLSQKIYDEFTGIQYGEKEDKHHWLYSI